MIFLVDAQLPPALAHWLTQQGHTARHVDEFGLREAKDTLIWDHALSTGTIIVTKDEDFAERTARTSTSPVIVWLRFGNATNRRSCNGSRHAGRRSLCFSMQATGWLRCVDEAVRISNFEMRISDGQSGS